MAGAQRSYPVLSFYAAPVILRMTDGHPYVEHVHRVLHSITYPVMNRRLLISPGAISLKSLPPPRFAV